MQQNENKVEYSHQPKKESKENSTGRYIDDKLEIQHGNPKETLTIGVCKIVNYKMLYVLSYN